VNSPATSESERRHGERREITLSAEIGVGKTRITVETSDISPTGALFWIPGLDATKAELAEYATRRFGKGISITFGGGVVRCPARPARVTERPISGVLRPLLACKFGSVLSVAQCELLGIPRSKRPRLDLLLD
jgi:hypothetical protein